MARPQCRGREQDIGQTSQQSNLRQTLGTVEATQDKNNQRQQSYRQIDKNDEDENIGKHFTIRVGGDNNRRNLYLKICVTIILVGGDPKKLDYIFDNFLARMKQPNYLIAATNQAKAKRLKAKPLRF